MADSTITVIGGSGFLGRHIVRRLADDGADIRVAVRHPERVAFPELAGKPSTVTPVHADVWDEASVDAVVAGADAVVNTVGHYVERGAATFDAIHGQGALHVARASARAGVRRLVHISGLGSDPASDSPYARARGLGERLVREAFPQATVLRPSVVFGPGDVLFNRLAGLSRLTPILPLFGRGTTRLQPVYVGDVAEAVGKALAGDDAAGKVYELGGPRSYTYRSLVQLAVSQAGRRRLLLPIPYLLWEIVAMVPNPLISRDQVTLMRKDNVVSDRALRLTDLEITPTPVETVLPRYLR